MTRWDVMELIKITLGMVAWIGLEWIGLACFVLAYLASTDLVGAEE